MAFNNRMEKLLAVIEGRLGTKSLYLPKGIRKEDWVKWIELTTLEDWSRFFPNKITIDVNRHDLHMNEEGYYLLDERLIPGDVEIINVKDIPWDDPQAFGPQTSSFYNSNINISGFDAMYPYTFGDMIGIQNMANIQSLFSCGILVKYQPPNKVKLVPSCGDPYNTYIPQHFKLDVFVKHSINLSTITPTMMNTFTELAIADVADFIYQALRNYKDVSSVFAHSNMNIDDFQSKAEKREQIIEKLDEAHVSADNANQPIMYTI